MDSLANYGSDGDNSNNSDDTKMPCSKSSGSPERRASDANYDPVQMDMSEESNNNNSSGESGSERVSSPSNEPRSSCARRDSPRHRYSPADQRRSDHDSHSSNSRDDQKRSERKERKRDRRSSERSRSRHSSHDERSTRGKTEHSRDSREGRKSRDEERKSSRDEERRRERKSASSCKEDHRNDTRDEKNRHRNDRRDRDRDRSERSHRRDRERRGLREDRAKERHRDERSSRDSKEKARSRSKSKDRAPLQPPFRNLSYREGKGRNKLAQLEKLGIELKAPVIDPVIPPVIGEPNYYNPLATATQGKYAEQIQKRKLLWANKSKQEDGKTLGTAASTASTWMGTTFTHDQDGKVTAKFKRLMGIKEDTPIAPQPGAKPDILKKQEEMFNNMEQQYEVARATTHTQRGVGLGYATGSYQFPR